MFITFEGINGCGKTTQAALLSQYFIRQKQREVLSTFEPLNLNHRRLIFGGSDKDSKISRLQIFLLDREQHQDSISSVLSNNGVVICDRYIDSTIAYQGYGEGISVEQIKFLNTDYIVPDLTFWIDTSVDESLRRCQQRGDKENRNPDYLAKVFNGYEQTWVADHKEARGKGVANRIHRIEGDTSIEKIHNSIIKQLVNYTENIDNEHIMQNTGSLRSGIASDSCCFRSPNPSHPIILEDRR